MIIIIIIIIHVYIYIYNTQLRIEKEVGKEGGIGIHFWWHVLGQFSLISFGIVTCIAAFVIFTLCSLSFF